MHLGHTIRRINSLNIRPLPPVPKIEYIDLCSLQVHLASYGRFGPQTPFVNLSPSGWSTPKGLSGDPFHALTRWGTGSFAGERTVNWAVTVGGVKHEQVENQSDLGIHPGSGQVAYGSSGRHFERGRPVGVVRLG